MKIAKTEITEENEEKKEVPKPKKVTGTKMFQALMRFNLDDDIQKTGSLLAKLKNRKTAMNNVNSGGFSTNQPALRHLPTIRRGSNNDRSVEHLESFDTIKLRPLPKVRFQLEESDPDKLNKDIA